LEADDPPQLILVYFRQGCVGATNRHRSAINLDSYPFDKHQHVGFCDEFSVVERFGQGVRERSPAKRDDWQ